MARDKMTSRFPVFAGGLAVAVGWGVALQALVNSARALSEVTSRSPEEWLAGFFSFVVLVSFSLAILSYEEG